jgi:hypothetical protein
MNRDHRRTQQRRVAKMIMLSKAYIVVMWDGVEKVPTALIDCAAFTREDNKGEKIKTPLATSFGEIASFIIGSVQNCAKKATLTLGQLAQQEHFELVREQKSAHLQSFLTEDDKKELADKEAREAGAAPADPVPAAGLLDANGKMIPFKTKADKSAENKN